MALSRSGMLNEKKLGFSPGALLRKEVVHSTGNQRLLNPANFSRD